MQRYSGRSDLLKSYDSLAKHLPATVAREVTEPFEPYQLRHRLDPDILANLIQDYADGVATTQLMSLYGLSKGSVLKRHCCIKRSRERLAANLAARRHPTSLSVPLCRLSTA